MDKNENLSNNNDENAENVSKVEILGETSNERQNHVEECDVSVLNEEQNKKPKMDKGLKVFLWTFGVIVGLAVLFLLSAITASYLKNNNINLFSSQGSQVSGNTPTLNTKDRTEDENAMSAQEVYAKVAPSIVGIVTYNPSKGLISSGAGQGSGIIMTEDGYIITNAHVIGNSNKYNVTVVIDNKEYQAKVVGFDVRTDLAVVKIDANGLSPATFGNSDQLAVGEWVLAIGNPGGLEFSNSLTRGLVSALNRSLKSENSSVNSSSKFIQTDAAINPGNSGGALVNMYGQVIGINTAKVKDFEGMGFAIPINTAKSVVDDIINKGYVSGRVKLGISVRPVSAYEARINDVPQGILILEINEGSNLISQGVKVGDIITKMDDVNTTNTSDLYGELNKHKAGDTVNLTLYRQSALSGQSTTLDVKVTLQEDKG